MEQTSRRRFLLGGGATVVAAACGSDPAPSRDASASSTTVADSVPLLSSSTTTGAGTSATAALTAADFDVLGTCALLPEQTAGPFPLDQQFDRRDITEGYPGHPLRLGFRVVDDACAPVAGAAVEVWHTDATGDYSAFADGGGGKDEGDGTTFLRGTQTAGEDGIVEFLSIYPGWYRGRAVHIHIRVHLDGDVALTSQVYFDDDYTASVHDGAEYLDNGLPDTSNDADGIAGDPEADGTLLELAAGGTANGVGTVALLNLGI